jgi:hypothetical protein
MFWAFRCAVSTGGIAGASVLAPCIQLEYKGSTVAVQLQLQHVATPTQNPYSYNLTDQARTKQPRQSPRLTCEYNSACAPLSLAPAAAADQPTIPPSRVVQLAGS